MIALKWLPTLQLVSGAALISFSPVFVKLAHVSPTTSAFYRTAFGGLVLVGLTGQWQHLIAALSLFGLTYVLWSGGGIGGGDVWLAIYLGLALGLDAFLAILLGSVIGLAVSAALIIRGSNRRRVTRTGPAPRRRSGGGSAPRSGR